MFNKININKEDIKGLEHIFKYDDKQEISVHLAQGIVSTKVYIDSYEESNLYFYIYNNEVVVQNISVTNRRSGIGTKLIKECAKIGKNKGVEKIRIQSVLTDEMVSLCKKLNIAQDTNLILSEDKGDYISTIENILNK